MCLIAVSHALCQIQFDVAAGAHALDCYQQAADFRCPASVQLRRLSGQATFVR